MTKLLRSSLGIALGLLVLAPLAPGIGLEAAGQTLETLDLATLFEPGNLVVDENGDGVPDQLGATILLPPSPSDVELAAASEIAARLGFETMALDLPLRTERRDMDVGILIGSRALAAEGLDADAFRALATGGAAVATLESRGARWLAVLGETDQELMRAARFLAGALPHTESLSSPSLADVAGGVAQWLDADTTVTDSDYRVAFHSAVLESEPESVRLVATLIHPDAAVLS
ncbi:MAG: hypothetical protein ACR2QM_20940, partial [Longimicrobiales bacterium]